MTWIDNIIIAHGGRIALVTCVDGTLQSESGTRVLDSSKACIAANTKTSSRTNNAQMYSWEWREWDKALDSQPVKLSRFTGYASSTLEAR